MNSIRRTLAILCPLVLAATACTKEAPVPEPPDLVMPSVPEGSASLVVSHAGEALNLDHLKVIQRMDEGAGAERIHFIFTATPVNDEWLTDPFQPFYARGWALEHHPEIRPVLSVTIDPKDPGQLADCELLTGWQAATQNCDLFDSRFEFAAADGSVSGTAHVLDFFGGEDEQRGWLAAGEFQAALARFEPLTAVTGSDAQASPQVRRLLAMRKAIGKGDMAAIQEHVMPASYAELQATGEEPDTHLIDAMSAAFADIDPTAAGADLKLYNAGKRSRLVLVQSDPSGMTLTQYVNFRWVDGKWLLEE